MRKRKRPPQESDDFLPLREEEALIRKQIARLVAEQLRASQYDRAELAAKLGYRSPTQLSKWVSGKALIPPEKLALLADILQLPVASFFPARARLRPWQTDLASAIMRADYRAALTIMLAHMPADEKRDQE